MDVRRIHNCIRLMRRKNVSGSSVFLEGVTETKFDYVKPSFRFSNGVQHNICMLYASQNLDHGLDGVHLQDAKKEPP